MLVQIAIRDIVLIERLDLQLGPGLTILTGETGAGKSILLDAFSLALGSRGIGALVREGQAQGQVTAVFRLDANHPAAAAVRRCGVECGEDLILRRVQYADGRTRAFLNDQPVSVQSLRSVGAELVEIHGQHDDRALIDPATHRQLVDAFGGLSSKAAPTRLAHQALRKIRQEILAEEERLKKVRGDADYLQHAHAELTSLAADVNEEDELAGRRARMMQAEKVASELADAHNLLSGEHSPTSAMVALMRRLARRAEQAPALIDPCLAALDSAVAAAEAASEAVERALHDSRYDQRELEQVEERLFALRAAGRKYGVRPDDLPALAEKFGAELAALDAGEARLADLTRKATAALADYLLAAGALSKARLSASLQLAEKVNAELPPLKLEGARFHAEIQTDPATESPDGFDRIEFWAQTNPGTRPGPLMKVASGGELARFMLALKVALADRGSAPTLVFDEIDTGVGGAVADAIGQRLARLASGVQVLAVTHAPQVAARAKGHFRIAKHATGEGQRVATRILALEHESRREEIARMLAGATITEEARAAARRLLEAG